MKSVFMNSIVFWLLLTACFVQHLVEASSIVHRSLDQDGHVFDEVEEELEDFKSISSFSQRNRKQKGGANDVADEYSIEFKAFNKAHKLKLKSYVNDIELSSAFGDRYGVFTGKIDKRTGKQKLFKLVDNLGDADTIKKCIYKGKRDDGGEAVFVTCQGLDYLLIVNVEGRDNEEIKVRKDKKTGKMKATKTIFSESYDEGGRIFEMREDNENNNGDTSSNNNNNNGRRLGVDECSIAPQKYLSMVIVNTISRVNKFSSTLEVEADTVAQFVTGKVSYDRTTTLSGCNIILRLAGQVLETQGNKLIQERRCNEVDTTLAAVQTSHNANSGANGCCSRFPIVWSNCPNGNTYCWNANSPDYMDSWSSAAPHPVPGVDFTTNGGCYNLFSFGSWWSGSKTVHFYGMNDPYLSETSSAYISHESFLDATSDYFAANAASLRSTFGDVDNVQAWTENNMHGGTAGFGWMSSQCNDRGSTAVVTAKYGVGVWLHELGHNLGMSHVGDGIMTPGRRLNNIKYFSAASESDLETYFIDRYGVNGRARCLENDRGTGVPTLKPTQRPDFIPTRSPTSVHGGKCDPYICGGSNCGPGHSCYSNGLCYNWNGVNAYESCNGVVCDPGLSCHPELKICMPCSGTESPTLNYIPNGAIGDKCKATECGASNCDPKLTCDSDSICKKPGTALLGASCRSRLCGQGLSCDPITDTCVECSGVTKAPTTPRPTTSSPTTGKPTTRSPTTERPTTNSPTTRSPTSRGPTSNPTTRSPTTRTPTLTPTTRSPTTGKPTSTPTTRSPTTEKPTNSPNTPSPTAEFGGCQLIKRKSDCKLQSICKWHRRRKCIDI